MERLLEVSQKGNVHSLRKLLEEVPSLTLDEVFTSFCRTPLHIAVMCGRADMVKEILAIKPELALKVDSQGFTPLHQASARWHLNMVKVLVNANPDACMVQDQDGRTPLHLAVMNDRVKTVKMLLQERPEAIHLRNARNETILHFCVKNNGTVETLRFLVENSTGDQPANRDYSISVNSKDVDGNTILHLAAETGNMKVVKFLVDSGIVRVEINALNNKNLKAFDMLPETVKNELEIGCFYYYGPSENKKTKNDHKGRKERVNTLMVVATLIAGIAFQAANNPPGGLWQQDTKVRLLVVLMCISIGCILFGYKSVFIALTPDYLKNPTLISLYIFLGLWCIFGTGFFIWSLISNILKMRNYLIVGVEKYLKLAFSFDVQDVGKVILFICGLFVFLFLFLYKFKVYWVRLA
ncbi:ankyrin repeat-containing protein BDA1-like isoform X3 [Papaver somniferum]|uniref:ankyrin repeat-containing protein BDA1-like isoform X3 n=1 Tax=Papaver somniferum TaxID=3469 RepID=UPI000E6FBE0A|nr:ankyrin repeat-containing protein BDA1-like isoform X3 [Papaver somniferum]